MSPNFDFTQTVILENERVLLRPLESTDVENLLWFALHEPEIWEYSVHKADSEAALKEYIAFALSLRASEIAYPFIVYDKQAGAYAGSTRFYDMRLKRQILEIGSTWYGRAFQGNGVNKHCKFLLLSYAFETMGMERVGFSADSKNQKSIGALLSLGCVQEGIIRSTHPTKRGERRDSMYFSILRHEWFGGVRQRLEARLVKR